jgi:hypothetical protein
MLHGNKVYSDHCQVKSHTNIVSDCDCLLLLLLLLFLFFFSHFLSFQGLDDQIVDNVVADAASKGRSEASLECWSQDSYDFRTRLAIIIIIIQVYIKWDLDKITDMTMEVESLTNSNM